MNKQKSIYITLIFSILLYACGAVKPFPSEMRNAIEKGNLVFNAQSAMPMPDNMLMSAQLQNLFPNGSAANIQLSSGYQIRLKMDTLTSNLPYYGRSFKADYNPQNSPLQFKDCAINTTITNTKKGLKELLIAPKNSSEVRSMRLSISPNGYAMLQVNCNNRQPISFYGTVEAGK